MLESSIIKVHKNGRTIIVLLNITSRERSKIFLNVLLKKIIYKVLKIYNNIFICQCISIFLSNIFVFLSGDLI